MIANYFIIDDISLKKLEMLPDSEKITKIDAVLDDISPDNNIVHCCDIDTFHDGLYFWLSTYTDNDKDKKLLYKFVFGDNPICNTSFISYIKTKNMREMLAFIESINIENILFNPKEFKKNNIYPNIWDKEDAQFLKDELMLSFFELKDMYNKAIKEDKNIIISII